MTAAPRANEALVIQLASQFAALLRTDLSQDTLVEVDRLNRAERDPQVCHSHDFCDANIVMDWAFEQVVRRPVDLASDADTALWNSAWFHAKTVGFSSYAIREAVQAATALVTQAVLAKYPWLQLTDGNVLRCTHCDTALEVVERATHSYPLCWDPVTGFYEGKQAVEESESVVQCQCAYRYDIEAVERYNAVA